MYICFCISGGETLTESLSPPAAVPASDRFFYDKRSDLTGILIKCRISSIWACQLHVVLVCILVMFLTLRNVCELVCLW